MVASLNALASGFHPAEEILDSQGNFMLDGLCPGLSNDPLDKRGLGGPVTRCFVSELRGDWKFYKDAQLNLEIVASSKTDACRSKEWLNMRVGWAATEICHHCHVRKDAFLETPSQLGSKPRRSPESFRDECLHPGNKSPLLCILLRG